VSGRGQVVRCFCCWHYRVHLVCRRCWGTRMGFRAWMGGRGRVVRVDVRVGGIPVGRVLRRVGEACWVEDDRSCWRSRGVVRVGSGRDDRVGWRGCCWGYCRGLGCWIGGVGRGNWDGGIAFRDLMVARFCAVVVVVVAVVVVVVVAVAVAVDVDVLLVVVVVEVVVQAP